MKRLLNGIWMARLAVGLAAVGLLATAANAQGRFVGRFTLPCETSWNGETLGPGDYTVSVPSLDQAAYVRVDSESGSGRFYIHSNIVGEKSGGENVILLRQSGDRCEVRAMNLADINEEFVYKPIYGVEMASFREGQPERLLAVQVSKAPAARKH